MDDQPKNKIFIIIIGVLLIANIIMLAVLLIPKNQKSKQGHPDRSVYISDFLKNEIGFSDAQLAKYEALSDKHRSESRSLMSVISRRREEIIKRLPFDSFNNIAIANAAGEIMVAQNGFEIKMLEHIKNIRDLCNAEQRPKFDSTFYRIIGRRKEDSTKIKN